MPYSPVTALHIYCFGIPVGALAPIGQRGTYGFEYEPTWQNMGIELSPVSMPVGERARVWSFPQLNHNTFYGLPPLLADSLPDRFGNSVINVYLANQGVLPEDVTPLDRLSYLGNRGMGALTFVPAVELGAPQPTSIELSQLIVAARAALRGDLARTPSEALHDLLMVGASAGGARAKAVIAWDRNSNEIRAGNLPAPDRFEQWLLKFDGIAGTDKGKQFGESGEFGRIEYAYSLMARSAGIDVPETQLIEEGPRAHFAIKRFDRNSSEYSRMHLQTLCALDALDYNLIGVHSYSSLMLRAINLDDSEYTRQEVFRRISFNVLAANNDDHTKNHSFLMDAAGTWYLSPAYDLTFAYDPNNKWLKEHLMSVEGKFSGITKHDLQTFADRYGVSDYRAQFQQVRDAVSNWPEFAKQAGLSAARTNKISAHLIELDKETT